MADINNVTMIGRLTKEPEIKTFEGGKMVAKFSIAVNGWKKDQASFWNCQVWNKSAEFTAEYCNKGDRVAITGSMACDEYEKDGEKKQWIYVNCNSIQNLQPKPTADVEVEF